MENDRNFSALQRTQLLEKLKTEKFDLIIIGGGITGAGIALDAASRGLKIALLEKHDFAYGTSSRSTKLIHGGLRYLKQLEFGLVKEVGSERAVVHNLAPHLVIPEKMLLPLYDRRGLGYWLTSIGLKIYDFLAGVKREDQRKMLTRNQTFRYEPLLKREGVKGGAIYAEYRTDDARLTIEIAKTAARRGAILINYAEVKDFAYTDGKISGVQVLDRRLSERFLVSGSVVVSAAGPWVDELRTLNQSRTGKRLHLTKGVHIVVPHQQFPIHQAIYFDVEDGRMIFAIPRGRVTYIGTTDTNFEGDKEHVIAERKDAEYLLKGVHGTFTNISIDIDHVESSWAGLRPLIHEEGKSASELSRKDEIFESATGLISIAGGKLTGYRKMAERVVNLVIKKSFSDRQLKPCTTGSIKLTEDSFHNHKQVKAYINSIADRLKAYALSGYTSRYLVETYGKQSESILKHFLSMSSDEEAELALLKAEADHAIHHEMATNLEDFFVRRTGLLYFEVRKVIRYKTQVAAFFQQQLGWTDTEVKRQLDDIDKLVEDATRFRKNSSWI